MATLDSLRYGLRQATRASTQYPEEPLTEAQYDTGFGIIRDSGWATYEDFIIPQLSQVLEPLLISRGHISVLEIGPGRQSVLRYLPNRQRRNISRYAAFEPNAMFADILEAWMTPRGQEISLSGLKGQIDIRRTPFTWDSDRDAGSGSSHEKFDLVLFCHSMYGMHPKRKFLERALGMLTESGRAVVFHREGLHLDGLVCHKTAPFPTGVVRIVDDDQTLDSFAPFIAGFAIQDVAIRAEWRRTCRAVGRREYGQLSFSAPEVMTVFTQHAAILPEMVPMLAGGKTVKNQEACIHRPAAVVKPTEVLHIQECVRWALKHDAGLTVVGGGHSGHCLQPNVVAVDMSAFDQVHVLPVEGNASAENKDEFSQLTVVEGGCTTGDIIHKTMKEGLTVPLGARPSVGAGLWLQGGIGHLARMHGLACDAIVGAVVVSVADGNILMVGRVPRQHQPAGVMRPENEADLLWALKGAGTNFGIVVSVTFRTYAAPTSSVRNWTFPLADGQAATQPFGKFAGFAKQIPRNCSADAYLYWDIGQLHLGVTVIESSTTTSTGNDRSHTHKPDRFLGPEVGHQVVDGVGLFDTEMYISGMHGGHGGGKTSSFKRCLFLNSLTPYIAVYLVDAMKTRPSQLCYFHLLHGGGAIRDATAGATAFGCRDWDFAIVITGVWPRDEDGTEATQAAVRWVYGVVEELLPLSSGAYGADLGPDPRDAALAAQAFGPNLPRLARLKQTCDPRSVLASACPLLKAPMKPGLVILVTGRHGTGKDYCAAIWDGMFRTYATGLTARTVRISDVTKREYAAATGADLNRLLIDRAYKEEHRPELTAFWHDQVQQRLRLPEEHFLDLVYDSPDVDVLFITGMRDEAPVAAFSHLVPDIRLLEVRVVTGEDTRRSRRGDVGNDHDNQTEDSVTDRSEPDALDYRPSLIFDNDENGDEAAKTYATRRLLPFFDKNLQKLSDSVRTIEDFPRPGIDFQHVLGISEQYDGLRICTRLLQSHFAGDWARVDAMACCEAGGFIFATALASAVSVPLALIRQAGKLPPPTFSVVKSPSHVSSSASGGPGEEKIEMSQDIVSRGSKVVVVDDVLATGETLSAVLQLLGQAGVDAKDISVMVVAEFPVHRGRELLRQRGFGTVSIRSLLVFGGA